MNPENLMPFISAGEMPFALKATLGLLIVVGMGCLAYAAHALVRRQLRRDLRDHEQIAGVALGIVSTIFLCIAAISYGEETTPVRQWTSEALAACLTADDIEVSPYWDDRSKISIRAVKRNSMLGKPIEDPYRVLIRRRDAEALDRAISTGAIPGLAGIIRAPGTLARR